ncbi:MAG: FixH family protein, partial [Bradymonadaceae bacterium]
MMIPPPHILYPGMVLGLLAMSLTTSFSILFFAGSDGGPQIERSYYERSVSWDADQKARGAAERLGWLVDLDSSGSLRVVGPEEQPVLGLAGTVVTR